MIRLFRLDGLELMLNVDQIKDIQAGPPTLITLQTGERLPVKNSLTDVLTKVRAWRQGKENEEREGDSQARGNGRPRRPPPAAPAACPGDDSADAKPKEPQ